MSQGFGAFALIFPLCALLAGIGCRPALQIGTSRNDLVQRLGQRLLASGTFRDAQEVLLKERARGEEGRARLLMEVLWLNDDPIFRDDLLKRFIDVPRPDRAPYIDQELGLEPGAPSLYSTAAPGAMRRLGQALLGQGLVPALVGQADAYTAAGEFIEAAGVLTLARAALRPHPEVDATEDRAESSSVDRAWRELASQRRCVAAFIDAARPGLRHLDRLTGPPPSGLQEGPGVPAERAVEATLAAGASDPATLPCAVLAIQMASTQPARSPSATRAQDLLIAIHLHGPQYASFNPYSDVTVPPPLILGQPDDIHRALVDGIGRFLLTHPGQTRRLLPLLSRGPETPLLRQPRQEIALGLIFYAPPVPEAAERIAWAYQHHHSVVAADPLRYVEYQAGLGPGEDHAALLSLALREPQETVLAAVLSALSSFYSLDAVNQALSPPKSPDEASMVPAGELQQERALRREHTLALRALFRLPVDASAAEQHSARQAALDLHRCCRGTQGSCDRLAVARITACPAWTPLRWW